MNQINKKYIKSTENKYGKDKGKIYEENKVDA